MNSEIKTDIFYKASTPSKGFDYDDILVSSSLFTSETPDKNTMNDITDSAYLNRRLMKLHKSVFDSDFMPNNITEASQTGGKKTETDRLPIISESTYTASPYEYSSRSSTSSSSYTSSSETESSSSSSPPPPKKRQPIKKGGGKKAPPKKQPVKKGSRKGKK